MNQLIQNETEQLIISFKQTAQLIRDCLHQRHKTNDPGVKLNKPDGLSHAAILKKDGSWCLIKLNFQDICTDIINHGPHEINWGSKLMHVK